MTQSLYSDIYISVSYVIGILFCLYVSSYRSSRQLLPSFSPYLSYILCVMAILGIAFCPSGFGSDKERYEIMFLNIEHISFKKDVLWQYYNVVAKSVLNDVFLFFLCTAIFYVWSNYKFVKAFVRKEYRSCLILLMFLSLGFFGYGMNTIRAGVALGFFLLAITKSSNLLFFFVLSTISIGFHKSIFIPFIAYCITFFCRNTKLYLWLWVVMFACSALNVTTIKDFVISFFSDYDNRVTGYMTATENELYVKAGFRIDFIIYSLFPMVMGSYYVFKKKFEDDIYSHILNTYIITNAFWLLIIRIPYTDRFAYLSWFLAPFILLYPLLKERLFSAQSVKVAMIIFIMSSINFTISVIR